MKLKHLVIVIPGILGSVLETRNHKPVWGQGRAVLAAAAWQPERLSVAVHPVLVPTGLLPSMTVLPPLPWGVPGYDGLVDAIGAAFTEVRVDVASAARPGATRDLAADVVLFPYDFRLGVEHAAHQLATEIAARLSGLTRAERARRVIIVAHSLGGLVARYWAGPLDGGAACRAIITLGTPHRGAPKALDWLANGVRVGGLQLDSLSEMLSGWPSVYDLLPRYQAIWDEANGRDIYPHQLAELTEGALGMLGGAAKISYSMHQDIEAAWADAGPGPDSAPDLVACFARGHATPAQANLAGGQLTVSRRDAHWLPNPGWGGDGTVPALSAIPIEADAARSSWLAVATRHTALPSTPEVVEILKNYTADSMLAVRGDAPARPWLGIDLDDGALAGQRIPVGARLHGVPATVGVCETGGVSEADGTCETVGVCETAGASETGGAQVWVIIHDEEDGRLVSRARLERDGDGGFAGHIDALPPGGYRVLVETLDVPGADRIICADVLAVLPG